MKLVMAMALIVVLAVLWVRLLDELPVWLIRNLLSVFVGRYVLGPVARWITERVERWRQA